MAFLRNFMHEFKQFAIRGNAIDLAVGIVIGAAFTKIVNSIVENVINPVTAYFIGSTDLRNKVIPLPPLPGFENNAQIGIGSVCQAVFEFFIVALIMFLVIRGLNRLNLHTPGQTAPPEDVRLLREIRDLLAKRETEA
jgi:large conductance mechanosensitive channel